MHKIDVTAPDLQSGAAWDLDEAVAIMGGARAGAELTVREIADIAAFLHPLSGGNCVVDPGGAL